MPCGGTVGSPDRWPRCLCSPRPPRAPSPPRAPPDPGTPASAPCSARTCARTGALRGRRPIVHVGRQLSLQIPPSSPMKQAHTANLCQAGGACVLVMLEAPFVSKGSWKPAPEEALHAEQGSGGAPGRIELYEEQVVGVVDLVVEICVAELLHACAPAARASWRASQPWIPWTPQAHYRPSSLLVQCANLTQSHKSSA